MSPPLEPLSSLLRPSTLLIKGEEVAEVAEVADDVEEASGGAVEAAGGVEVAAGRVGEATRNSSARSGLASSSCCSRPSRAALARCTQSVEPSAASNAVSHV
jgi:hypothetical protein